MSSAKCIMVQGTMSGAGKSLLCAALCRIFAQDGYKTGPLQKPEHGAEQLCHPAMAWKWVVPRWCRPRPRAWSRTCG